MGTGKTLMCLSLIVATLHQTCEPPPHAIDITPVVTDHAILNYPFQDISRLNAETGFEGRTRSRSTLPSLVDLCANVLAIHDHSARRIPNLPPSATPILNRNALYYQFPMDDDCMRQAKRKTLSRVIKRIYLANITLVVVPGILVQQWRDEMATHIEEGTMRVLEVGKVLPCIEDLLDYDVS